MEWVDHGIILFLQKHSENSSIVSCLTQNHGLCKGYVKNVKSKSIAKSIFIGNVVHLNWRARLENHLGTWKILNHETITPHFFHDAKKMAAASSLCELLNTLLPEHEVQTYLFAELVKFLYLLKDSDLWLIDLLRLELLLLKNIGYGLDLSQCAVTGQSTDLFYISPNSGRAVSKDAGEQYRNKLFLLPKVLVQNMDDNVDEAELIYALNVTKHFFEKYIRVQSKLEIPKIRIILQDILERK